MISDIVFWDTWCIWSCLFSKFIRMFTIYWGQAFYKILSIIPFITLTNWSGLKSIPLLIRSWAIMFLCSSSYTSWNNANRVPWYKSCWSILFMMNLQRMACCNKFIWLTIFYGAYSVRWSIKNLTLLRMAPKIIFA